MRVLSSALLLLGLCAAPSLHASVSFTGAAGQGTNGNSLPFGIITATAWSTDGTSNAFRTAALGQYSAGLGVCSQTELASGSPAACTSTSPVFEHSVSNELGASGIYDFILLTFSQNVTGVSFVLNPFGQAFQDMDATYFAGSCSPSATSCSPSGKTLATLAATAGFGGKLFEFTDNAADSGAGASTRTLNLGLGTNSSVNWILIGTATGGQTLDKFKLDSISYSTGVPEPATFGLAGAALAAIGLLRRKKLFSNS